MTPISVSDVTLDYSAHSSSSASRTLNAYLTAFFNDYTQTLDKSISTSLASAADQIKTLQASHPPPLSGRREDYLAAQIRPGHSEKPAPDSGSQLGFSKPGAATLESKPISKTVAVAGGAVAGLAAGVLLVLVASRLRGRVGDRSEIEELGVRVVEMDSSHDADPLRLELDVLGLGRGLRVVSVSPAAAADGSTGVGLALARAYAAIGAPPCSSARTPQRRPGQPTRPGRVPGRHFGAAQALCGVAQPGLAAARCPAPRTRAACSPPARSPACLPQPAALLM